ncbi:MAG TPA: radical SAM protein, partial [bacterium]|nr:radical SAM protein [bacterium]
MTLDQHPGHDRLSEKAVLHLATEGDFLSLADLANSHAKKLHGHRIAYLIDCNINYTNICRTQCAFCAFSRPKGHTEAWELSKDELDKKIQNAKTRGSQRVLLQGGMHPDHTLTDYEQLVAHIKQTHHIHVHAFSPPEIHFIAEKSGVTTKHVLERLISAGLDSLPGGGAEILVDDVRQKISPLKCTANEWIDVMRVAHKLGLKTTATMMFGHIETWQDRINHL